MSNEYRLKQWYPSLRDDMKVGDTISKCKNRIKTGHGETQAYVFQGELAPYYIPVSDVENYPEFWEKIEEKGYEILKVKGKSSGVIKDQGLCNFSLPLKHHVIYSIERLSDNEVFTIGDKVVWDWASSGGEEYFEITKIYKKDNDKFIFHIGSDHGFSFKDLTKDYNLRKYKEPVFTTQDGVDIYPDDTAWFVEEGSSSDTPSRTHGEFSHNFEKFLYFSTYEAAKEYIKSNNKVLFTTDDGIDIRKNEIFYAINFNYKIVKGYGSTDTHNIDEAKGRFSTRKKAEEWIEKHKPQYSKADVERVSEEIAKQNYIPGSTTVLRSAYEKQIKQELTKLFENE